MKALEVFRQNNGEVTKAYYAQLAAVGPLGEVAVAVFRAQKRSTAAKTGRHFRRENYGVKAWSMEQICKTLDAHPELDIRYGWKQDPTTLFGNEPAWVLYVDLPTGQVSFHSPARGNGPEYPGDWDGMKEVCASRIIQFCDCVMSSAV